ncbi:MAG: AAA family ATPase [Desulfobacteraceae bacterium]|nr:AAA family ATPase [Desulfobacteraceae bacterium]
MQTKIPDMIDHGGMAGFRLNSLELLNWGTFHKNIWVIDPKGSNSLLTGDIGSGKSTLVDAVTTLLVPHNRIMFNKAAGAGARERTLYSYIRGEYKNVKYEYEQSGKPVALRDENDCTILLGYFYNQGFDRGVTLAQVFWLKDNNKNPERFFIISESRLSITADFTDFGDNLLDLRKRLKQQPNVQVMDSFKTYGSRFRRILGIQAPQALDLFHQTVSMKSVGNLTRFIRLHMLDRTNVEDRIRDIRKNFDSLNLAHGAVIKAKKQIELLTPVSKNGEKFKTLKGEQDELVQCRDALNAYFAHILKTLLKKRLDQIQRELKKVNHNLNIIEQDLQTLRKKQGAIVIDIDDNGGRRIRDIRNEIRHLESERERKKALDQEYITLAQALGLSRAKNLDIFVDNQKKAVGILNREEQNLNQIQDEQVNTKIAMEILKEKISDIDRELASLKARKSNIPLKNLELRRKMAQVLNLNEADMPFIGELIKVDENHLPWEGALERLLHTWGLSLVVPDRLYRIVAQYVDQTHLKGRLVYFRVQASAKRTAPGPGDERSLVNRVMIKPDTPYHGWISQGLCKRFDYICCNTMEDFYRLPRAITKKGQIKTGKQRHEKDDRHSIHDRSRYILGWQNKEKIKTLEKIKSKHEQDGNRLFDQLKGLVERQESARQLTDHCRQFKKFMNFDQIQWQKAAKKIHLLDREKETIENSSDILLTLKKQLEAVELKILELENERRRQGDLRGRIQQQFLDKKSALTEAKQEIETFEPGQLRALFPRLNTLASDALKGKVINLNNFKKSKNKTRDKIQDKIGGKEKRLSRLNDKIISGMQNFKNTYPEKTSEADASIDSLNEFNEILNNLLTQDLPRHEARFKELLNTGTINSIVLFQNRLDKKRREIEKKINIINTSLQEVEYSPGTFIELLIAPSQDSEIRDFKTDLKQCLSHTLDGEDIYNEKKFLAVKKLLDRFNTRQGYADIDKKWTAKVTDVRNWFVFSAVEKWQETYEEKEFYSDSSGKSGGQKEKLAYTILAAALAFQFGLEWGEKKSRTFRFVVIDEAFGRGSDESTRYGLELFKKLNLQLLIVTPLQKINIIEDYISAVHFVHNEDGKYSVLKNLTVNEYREQKKQFIEKEST